MAELGPLPPGGLPVIPKRRPNVKYSCSPAIQAIDVYAKINEQKEMLKQAAAIVALSLGINGCQPHSTANQDNQRAVQMHLTEILQVRH